MEHVLKNEVVYSDGNQTEIYLSYNLNRSCFGLLKKTVDGNQELDAEYLFIHPFENERAAALRQSGEFVWLDTALQETEMDILDKLIWECLWVKNPTCNCCYEQEILGCEQCDNGEIFVKYNFRLAAQGPGLIQYGYTTVDAFYTITLTEWDRILDLKIHYVWEKDELLKELRAAIETNEEQIVGNFIRICVIERAEDKSFVRLIPYSIAIEKTVTTKPASGDNFRNILGYDDYPYAP